MSQFFVFDASTGVGIENAKVVVRKDADNSVVFTGFTDASGKVDFTILSDTPHTVLVYKTGAYDGVLVSLQLKSGVLYPASVSLVKVTSRLLKLKVAAGVKTNVLPGAATQVFDAANTLNQGGFTDAGGGKQFTLPANLTGWKVVITAAGLDGVSFPLDKIDLLGEVLVVLNPTLGPGD